MLLERKCKTCDFYEPSRLQSDAGTCHKETPKAIAVPQNIPGAGVQMQIQSYFTPVPADEWCGCWQPKPQGEG